MSDRSPASPVIDGQLALYQNQAEAWQVEHRAAMRCFDLEALISFGLHLHRMIAEQDEVWSEAVRCGRVQLRGPQAQQLERWYRTWLAPCDRLVAQIATLEHEGYSIRGAGDFRQAALDVKAALSIPVDRLMSEDLSMPRKTQAEVRDAIRRRMGAGG